MTIEFPIPRAEVDVPGTLAPLRLFMAVVE
jgi:hypothetical protein